jgi:hypothetical protein
MRQHSIPQNVLDVEFKLFTRFTIKEFVYMFAGISIGSIFIFLWTEGSLHGIIAFPVFLFFAGIGLILGLVPINDQPADQFIINYINAINNPTQRVWQNKDFKEKMELVARQRGLTFDKIQVDSGKKGISLEREVNIIGGIKGQKTEENEQKTVLDLEEEEKLEKIDILFEETGLIPKKKGEQLNQIKQNIKNNPGNNLIKELVITNETVGQYAIPNLNVKLTGTVNMVLNNTKNEPIIGATVIIKDSSQKPILAVKSGSRGEVLTNRIFPNGEYNIDILHDQNTFPKIKFIVQEKIYPVVKIKSI